MLRCLCVFRKSFFQRVSHLFSFYFNLVETYSELVSKFVFSGSELSKTVATFILQKILLDDTGDFGNYYKKSFCILTLPNLTYLTYPNLI